MNDPLVSVIMPAYNCEKYISEAIESVINQTYSNWELWITDDCSTDNTVAVITDYLSHDNIHLIRLLRNEGTGAARAHSMEKASGKYIAFLDGDDIWDSCKLEKQIGFMESMGSDFSCTSYRKITEQGDDIHKVIVPPERINYKKCLWYGNPMGNLTVVYNREKLGNLIAPTIRKRNDFALWLQILKITECCHGINEILASYRVSSCNSISKNKAELIRYHWILYHDIEKKGIAESTAAIISCIFHKLVRL